MKKLFLISMFIIGSFSLIAETTSGEMVLNDSSSTEKIRIERVYENLEDEYFLAKIFFNSEQKRYYKKLDNSGKRLFLDAFWAANDPNPATEKNEFLEIIRARIDYCNSYFGHFKKGWKTDMGRILIRHGIPYEIIKDRSDILAKHGDKEYQIWKYRVTKDLTFIFLDLQTSGDFRLIFSENDDKEASYPDWLEYLGNSFDTGILY
jgi:GWxTD domain-containing protein